MPDHPDTQTIRNWGPQHVFGPHGGPDFHNRETCPRCEFDRALDRLEADLAREKLAREVTAVLCVKLQAALARKDEALRDFLAFDFHAAPYLSDNAATMLRLFTTAVVDDLIELQIRSRAAPTEGTAEDKPCACGQLTDGFCEAHPLGAADDTTALTETRGGYPMTPLDRLAFWANVVTRPVRGDYGPANDEMVEVRASDLYNLLHAREAFSPVVSAEGSPASKETG